MNDLINGIAMWLAVVPLVLLVIVVIALVA